MTNLGLKRTGHVTCSQRPDQGCQIDFFILATSPRLSFRTEPRYNFRMRFARFRVRYLRKIQLQPIENCLPEHLSELGIDAVFWSASGARLLSTPRER